MTEEKEIIPRKYVYPPKEELERLYITENRTMREIGKIYNLPIYTVSFVLNKKYHLFKSHELKSALKTKKKVAIMEAKGLTKEVLIDLYVNQQISVAEISRRYDDNRKYIYKLMDHWNVPTRTKVESSLLRKDNQGRPPKTFIGKKVNDIKKQIESGEIDGSKIDHKKACVLLSCNPGIEKLRNLCNIYGFDFQILSNTYRKLETVWYKLNRYPLINVKIALTLYLRYKISQTACSEICHITPVSFRTFYRILTRKIKLTKTKREDPLSVVNIRWLFDNPNLPEIYETLPSFSAPYNGYYCNVKNKDCNAFDPWTNRCNKATHAKCFYAFTKGKRWDNKN